MSSETPISQPTPTSLRVVAGIFLFFGLTAVVDIVVRLAFGTVYLTFGVLGIPVYYGLLRHNANWRLVALMFLWFGFIVLPLIALVTVLGALPSYFELFGIQIVEIPAWFVAASAVPFFFLNLWQYRVLTSPSVRSLFV
jgi:hypothetical protein